ncbi:MAG: ABC transporter ATP-binding protein/permease [Pseudomonadota bacterium]|nr:ABC transporter ATP-binding protein/permease [Pseudomonadota bacterium]
MTSGEQSAPQQPLPGETGEPIDLWQGLAGIFSHMSSVRRREFYLVLALMLGNALAELGTIGAVLPLLSLLSDPGGLGDHGWAVAAFDAVGAQSLRERLIFATAAFCAFAILAGMVRLELVRKTQDFSFRLSHELMLEVHRRFLLQPYSFHIQRTTSTLISAVDKIELLVFAVLLPVMQATTAAFIATAIMAALIYIDPFTALVAAAIFSCIYILVSAVAEGRLARNSGVISRGFDERLKILQESLGGIRDVIIDQSHAMYLRLFDAENGRLNEARANTTFIASAPRFVIEALGMIIIAGLALATAQREGGFAGAVPILGAIALGAQRLLPLVQQVYSSWSTVAGNFSVIGQTLELLQLPLRDSSASEPAEAMPLSDRISVDRVSFGYPTRRALALEDVSFEIPVRSAVALIGETGSGKSTLADLLMGLLDPSAGQILVDGLPLTPERRRQWQRSIAHVPQSIFLADASIMRNIALGKGDSAIDEEGVVDAARKAQLHEFVATLPEGYATTVGDRGIRLSGGQRQRLGIARAIYKRSPVLVLDEATSALDERTEGAVMEALVGLGGDGPTVITIAHRLSTIARCDIVVRLHGGRVVDIGSYADVVQAPAAGSDRASGFS